MNGHRRPVRLDRPPLDLWVVPILEDNYAYALTRSGRAWVVDPGAARPVISLLREQRLILDGVLITHHHGDHTAGLADLIRAFPAPVHGPADPRLPVVVEEVRPGHPLRVLDLDLVGLSTPGHAVPHLAFWLPEPKVLFTGDLLFAGGCGRVIEGSYLEMFASLESLRPLPDDAWVLPGHDYTEDNLRFAASLEPGHPEVARRLRWAAQRTRTGEVTVPSTLRTERATNPFLRVHDPAFRTACGLADLEPAQAFEALRRRKDRFG